MTQHNPALAGELPHLIVTSLVGSLGEHRYLLCAQWREVAHTGGEPRKAPTKAMQRQTHLGGNSKPQERL